MSTIMSRRIIPHAAPVRKPQVGDRRAIRIIRPATAIMPATIRITMGDEWTDYNLVPLAADFGKGFKLVQLIGHNTYNVNLHGGAYNTCLCDCRGHQQWGHCKHVDGLLALERAGKLP